MKHIEKMKKGRARARVGAAHEHTLPCAETSARTPGKDKRELRLRTPCCLRHVWLLWHGRKQELRKETRGDEPRMTASQTTQAKSPARRCPWFTRGMRRGQCAGTSYTPCTRAWNANFFSYPTPSERFLVVMHGAGCNPTDLAANASSASRLPHHPSYAHPVASNGGTI